MSKIYLKRVLGDKGLCRDKEGNICYFLDSDIPCITPCGNNIFLIAKIPEIQKYKERILTDLKNNILLLYKNNYTTEHNNGMDICPGCYNRAIEDVLNLLNSKINE